MLEQDDFDVLVQLPIGSLQSALEYLQLRTNLTWSELLADVDNVLKRRATKVTDPTVISDIRHAITLEISWRTRSSQHFTVVGAIKVGDCYNVKLIID